MEERNFDEWLSTFRSTIANYKYYVDFDIVYETEKHEVGDNVIGKDGNDAIYIIARKRSWVGWMKIKLI